MRAGNRRNLTKLLDFMEAVLEQMETFCGTMAAKGEMKYESIT